MNRHHKLLEEIGHLKDREHSLLSENDQLRAKLVDLKEQEKKKYDDLMVQYNMKREHRENGGLDRDGLTVKEEIKEEIKEEEDDGLDKQGTSNNQVTVKTEWDDQEVKVEIKEEDDEDCGWDRCVVKKEEVEDQIEDWVKREMKEEELNETTIKEEMVQVKEEIKEEDEEEEDGSAEIDSIEGWAESSQGGEDECGSVEKASMDPTVTHPTGQSQNASTRPETDQHRTWIKSNCTRHNKRKQQTSIRTGKRSKITIGEDEGEDVVEEDCEDGDHISNEYREESKFKVLHLNCTESNCNVKLDSLVHFYNHLSTVHQFRPLECYATHCNSRFDNPQQVFVHIKLHHSRSTRFLCPVCHKECDSQKKANNHWYKNHLTGQFKCNLVSNCVHVTDTRNKMTTHQQTKHQPNHFHCTQPGCTASFAFKANLKQHEQTHLNTNQFHCNWPHCSKQFKLRANLVTHIRTQHFGLPRSMKAQKEKNIVDLRDPNEYVRVVVDE